MASQKQNAGSSLDGMDNSIDHQCAQGKKKNPGEFWGTLGGWLPQRWKSVYLSREWKAEEHEQKQGENSNDT
ncbi:hypothetical protein MJO28_016828 [Puccinia striiformis f. sp. tritici]|nr:hypothetical protein MJO28_017867 [Puccinia striiformis f. sp. tritici]KAI7935301.1 hypothetical protein MJO28_016828 [Puccinia striiformis f. sp. tritici]KAI7941302.1 hypothetical protein MJO29_013376 [Puccinia striiformis f. sp. tritici]